MPEPRPAGGGPPDAPRAGGPCQDLLSHALATVAYRLAVALRAAPAPFGDFRAADGVRTPRQILRHMTHDLRWAERALGGAEASRPRALPSLGEETDRTHAQLATLARRLAEHPPDDDTARRLLQGPIADVLTHVGQIAMLRRMAGAPVPPESYWAADVRGERLGPHQPEPAAPHERWRPAEEEEEDDGPAR